MKKGVYKSGQITLFVVVGILIVAAIIGYSLLSSNASSFGDNFLEGAGLSEEANTIRQNLFSCIDEVSKQGLVTVGVQGGYYKEPEKFHNISAGFFSYYYYEGEFLQPTREDIEFALSEYIEDNLEACFVEKTYPIETTYTELIVTTDIQEEEVMFIVDSQVTFTEESEVRVIELKEQVFTQESYLYGMIEVATYLTEYHKTDPLYACFSCLSEIAAEYNVNAEIYNFEENTKHVIIYEEETNKPNLYMLSYLNKYTGEEVSPIFGEQ